MLVPPVVVGEELERRCLNEVYRFANFSESFHAIIPSWRYPNELVAEMLKKQKER